MQGVSELRISLTYGADPLAADFVCGLRIGIAMLKLLRSGIFPGSELWGIMVSGFDFGTRRGAIGIRLGSIGRFRVMIAIPGTRVW
jgi:hypothetical protein